MIEAGIGSEPNPELAMLGAGFRHEDDAVVVFNVRSDFPQTHRATADGLFDETGRFGNHLFFSGQ